VGAPPHEIRYARSGDVSIAYEVLGSGPDVVLAQGFVHNLAFAWEHPLIAGCLERLASFCRLIRFDRRGSGLSDRVREVPTLEARMDDLRTVMDAAQSLNSLRFGASPSAAATVSRMQMEVDVRDLLPAVRVPTLILHREPHEDESRYLEGRIPGAKRVELPGSSGAFFADDFERTAEELERFVLAVSRGERPETVLATVLFTDIVDSTKHAAELGDRAWTELVESHHALVRRLLDRFRGRELDTAGDGFFATFDGPARAIRCAWEVTQAAPALGLEVRAGLHTGECELIGGTLAGIAVNIGARIAAQAAPSEVLVSSTVKDLVAGSEIAFSDRGAVRLKGVPDEWRLYRVERT